MKQLKIFLYIALAVGLAIAVRVLFPKEKITRTPPVIQTDTIYVDTLQSIVAKLEADFAKAKDSINYLYSVTLEKPRVIWRERIVGDTLIKTDTFERSGVVAINFGKEYGDTTFMEGFTLSGDSAISEQRWQLAYFTPGPPTTLLVESRGAVNISWGKFPEPPPCKDATILLIIPKPCDLVFEVGLGVRVGRELDPIPLGAWFQGSTGLGTQKIRATSLLTSQGDLFAGLSVRF